MKIAWKLRILYIAKYAIRIKKKIKYVGDLNTLFGRKCKYAMNIASVVNKDYFENQAVKTLRNFLFHTNLNLQTKDSFNFANDCRYRVAKMYKKHIGALLGRSLVLSTVFDTEIGYLTKFFARKRKGVSMKRNIRIVRQLGAIKPEIKLKVLQLYMARMKFYYIVKTLKWFLLYR